MNSRERFLACMRFQSVDRAPNWEMGYWAGTLELGQPPSRARLACQGPGELGAPEGGAPVHRHRRPPSCGLAEHVASYKGRDWPLGIGGPFLGLFSSLRTLFGFERLMYAFFDDPQLVRDVLAHLTALWLGLFEEVLSQTDVDYAYFWEDMSFKSGSMVSPRIFREFLTPVYQRITAFFRAQGIDIILLDTDGNVWDLVPLFLEGGVTGLYPFEVRAGMNVAEVRGRYPRLQMMGGIDKNALVEGPQAIVRELARIAPVVKTGGYIPGVDHYVPPDVPWQHFAHYRRQLAQLL